MNLLIVFPKCGKKIPVTQLGAENNIEKSRCLAQSRKKMRVRRTLEAGFSGIRGCPAPRAA
jgi:hypothetical protein